MKFGSLFAGIGGIDLGLERAGMRCAWQVEKDPFCQRVLAKHWPSVKRYGDVMEVDARELKKVDVIAGGFPCQDLSTAGRKAGLQAERSGLWFEFRRILAAVLPDWAVVENIHRAWRKWLPVVRRELFGLGYASLPIRLRAYDFGAPHFRARCFVIAHASGDALRTMADAAGVGCKIARKDDLSSRRAVPDGDSWWAVESALDRVLGDLARCGYDAEWDCLPASLFGARQGRPRIFIVAYPRAFGLEILRPAYDNHRRHASGELVDGRDEGMGSGVSAGPGSAIVSPQPYILRSAPRIPNKSHRVMSLGNAVYPEIVYWIGRELVAAHQPRRQGVLVGV